MVYYRYSSVVAVVFLFCGGGSIVVVYSRARQKLYLHYYGSHELRKFAFEQSGTLSFAQNNRCFGKYRRNYAQQAFVAEQEKNAEF